ncbi:MAG: glycosyltransferase [Fibromonadaceae bacterium]|jgi:glycosyltransferase involved in cell wall biosynthesis|nr:glycosyltransferase [Fibromonadaceae bacterium]
MNYQNKPKISVIVPIYNKASFLEKNINSILRQTEKNIEIILADDGSTDNGSEICKKFAEKDSRILYKRKENEGLTATRNYGRKFATGDYISFVDPDDFIEANTYEQMLKCSNNADIVISGLIHELGNKKVLQTMPQNLNNFYENPDICKIILPLFLVYGKGIGENTQLAQLGIALFKRAFLEEQHILSDEKITYSEDWLFFLEALLKAQSVAIEHNAYYHYVHNAQGLTENYNPKVVLDYVEILRKLDKMGIFEYVPQQYSKHPNLAYNYLLQAIANLSVSKESIFALRKKAKNIFNMDYFNNLGQKINSTNTPFKKRILFYLVKFKLYLLFILLYKLKQKFYKIKS